MRKLSESQAWLELAQAWADPCETSLGSACVSLGAGSSFGLCPCLNDLLHLGAISQSTWDAMSRRMHEHEPPKAGPIYWWPANLKGAKARAAFARRMAALAKKTVTPDDRGVPRLNKR